MALHLVAAAVAVALHLVAAAVVDTDYTVVVRIVTVPSILRQVGLGMHPEKHNWPDHLAFAVAVVLYKFFCPGFKGGGGKDFGSFKLLISVGFLSYSISSSLSYSSSLEFFLPLFLSLRALLLL